MPNRKIYKRDTALTEVLTEEKFQQKNMNIISELGKKNVIKQLN